MVREASIHGSLYFYLLYPMLLLVQHLNPVNLDRMKNSSRSLRIGAKDHLKTFFIGNVAKWMRKILAPQQAGEARSLTPSFLFPSCMFDRALRHLDSRAGGSERKGTVDHSGDLHHRGHPADLHFSHLQTATESDQGFFHGKAISNNRIQISLSKGSGQVILQFSLDSFHRCP